MRVVLTGGSGFLGSHLTDRLIAEGHHVVAIDNFVTGCRQNIAHLANESRFELIEHDACLPLPITGPVDYVFHFASPASPVDFDRIPLEVLRVNSVGTENALERARANNAKFFLASTSEVYGDPWVSPQPESYWGNVNSIGPRSCYDEGKRYAEAITMAYHRHYGLDTRIVRFFNTYGPRMRLQDGRLVPNMIAQALRNEPLTIYGDGRQTRSFGYVDDVIDGVYRLAMSDHQLPVNLGSQDEMSVLAFALAVQSATGSTGGITHLEAAVDDPKRRRPDTTKAKELLGWAASTSFDEGLRRTIEYFRPLV